jgi:hypothetical protein
MSRNTKSLSQILCLMYLCNVSNVFNAYFLKRQVVPPCQGHSHVLCAQLCPHALHARYIRAEHSVYDYFMTENSLKEAISPINKFLESSAQYIVLSLYVFFKLAM